MSAEKPDRATVLAEVMQRLSKHKSVYERTPAITKAFIKYFHQSSSGTETVRSPNAPVGADYNEMIAIEEKTGESIEWLRYTGEYADELIEKAQLDPLAFDAACNVAAELVRQNESLSPKVREFVSAVLSGKKSRPKQLGRLSGSHNLREMEIVSLVQLVVDRGFTETRNDESKHRNSACDIVAEALKKLDLMPASYWSVKRIWLDSRVAD